MIKKQKNKKKWKITNKQFLKLGVWLSCLILTIPVIAIIVILNIEKLPLNYNPYKRAITFSQKINEKIISPLSEHKFYANGYPNSQNFLSRVQTLALVNEFNNKLISENLQEWNNSEKDEFLTKLMIKKFNDKYFYNNQEIDKITLRPIKINNSNGDVESYGLIDLEKNNNIYKITYNYFYQIVLYNTNSTDPIISSIQPLIKYQEDNIKIDTLIKKVPNLYNEEVNQLINDYFIDVYTYDDTIEFNGNLINNIIYYDSTKITSLNQLDKFTLKKSSSYLYDKIRNLKIDVSKNLTFNISSLPTYKGRKENEFIPQPPQFGAILTIKFDDYTGTIPITFEAYEIIIPIPKEHHKDIN